MKLANRIYFQHLINQPRIYEFFKISTKEGGNKKSPIAENLHEKLLKLHIQDEESLINSLSVVSSNTSQHQISNTPTQQRLLPLKTPFFPDGSKTNINRDMQNSEKKYI